MKDWTVCVRWFVRHGAYENGTPPRRRRVQRDRNRQGSHVLASVGRSVGINSSSRFVADQAEGQQFVRGESFGGSRGLYFFLCVIFFSSLAILISFT